CGWGAVDLNWGHCRTVEGILEDLLNPTDMPSSEGKPRLGTLRWTRPSPKPSSSVARCQGWVRSALSTSSLWMLWGCLGLSAGLGTLPRNPQKSWRKCLGTHCGEDLCPE
ncbi:hypothetical protein L3Q82_020962, partial [Scortum barcoo]